MLYVFILFVLAVAVFLIMGTNMADPTLAPVAETPAKKPRKKREKKSILTRLAEEAKRVANLKWDAAKALMGRAGDRFQNIAESRARLMRFLNESENLNDPEKVAEKVRNLEERKARLLARAAIAATYLPKARAAVEKVDKMFAGVGDAALAIIGKGRDVETVPADEAVSIISAHLSSEDLTLLASSTEDPYAAFRRAKAPADDEDAMPDAGTDTVAETVAETTENTSDEDAGLDDEDADEDDDFSDEDEDENATE